jgi:type IV fimbrial biogenesis protein FimT
MQQPERDSGFTLIELLVTISLLGVMMAVAVSGWSSWSQARAQSGAARELLSVMRQAQQRAVTEGRSTCVTFTTGPPSSYSVVAGVCGTAGAATQQMPRRVRLESASFAKPGTAGQQTGVQFNSRGTGWPGSVTVARSDSTSAYTLQVEVLTGHVALRQT